MLDRIAHGEVRGVMFLEVGVNGEIIIVDQENGFDLDSWRGVALCGICYGEMDLFSNRSGDGQVLRCMLGCGLRVAMWGRSKAATDIARFARRVLRRNVCGRCLGEKHVTMTPNLHGTANVLPGASENVACPKCLGSGEVA